MKKRINKYRAFFCANPVLILLILILLTDIIILFPFLSQHYVYMWNAWGSDTYQSYVPTLEYIARSVKMGRLESMSFILGQGSDVAGYGLFLGNPVFWIIILLALLIKDETIIPELMVLVPILVSVFGGSACWLFLKNKYRSVWAKLLSSYMYALCGYLFCTGTHYFFAVGLIYAPILLVAVDTAFEKERTAFLIVMVFLTGLLTVYFVLPFCLMTGFYVLYRFCTEHENRGRKLIRIIVSAALGIMCSAVLLIPNMHEILAVSGRVASEGTSFTAVLNSFRPITVNEFVIALSRMLSNNLFGGTDIWAGEVLQSWQPWFAAFPFFLSILFPLLAAQYVVGIAADRDNKKRAWKGIVLLLFTLTLITNCVSELTNMYSYNHWRMIFVLLPFFALMSADVIENILVRERFSQLANCCAGIMLLIFLAGLYQKGLLHGRRVIFYTGVLLVACVFILGYSGYLVKRKKDRTRIYIVMTCLILTVFLDYICDHRYSLVNGAKPILYSAEHDYYQDKALLDVVGKQNKDDFVRIEKTYCAGNANALWSMTDYCRSASSYNSVMNKNTQEYMTKIVKWGLQGVEAPIFLMYSSGQYGTLFDASRAALMGVNYMMSNRKRNLDEWEEISSDDNIYCYRNMTMQTGALLFSKAITTDEYESLDVMGKAAAESQAVILDAELPEFHDNTLEVEETPVNLAGICGDQQVISGTDERGIMVHLEQKSSLVIPLQKDWFHKNKRHVLLLNIEVGEEAVLPSVSISQVLSQEQNAVVGKSGKIEKRRTNIQNWMLSPGENTVVYLVDEDSDSLEITSVEPLDMTVTGASFEESPILYKDSCYLKNKDAGGTLEGTVYTDEDAVMYISVPYLSGWEAGVDDSKVPIMRANYGFSAIPISVGEHQIRMEYHNPVLKLSMVITGIGIILSALWMTVERLRLRSAAMQGMKDGRA